MRALTKVDFNCLWGRLPWGRSKRGAALRTRFLLPANIQTGQLRRSNSLIEQSDSQTILWKASYVVIRPLHGHSQLPRPPSCLALGRKKMKSQPGAWRKVRKQAKTGRTAPLRTSRRKAVFAGYALCLGGWRKLMRLQWAYCSAR